MNFGDRVRVKSASDRVGVIIGTVQILNGKKRWMVQFPDRKQRIPETNQTCSSSPINHTQSYS